MSDPFFNAGLKIPQGSFCKKQQWAIRSNCAPRSLLAVLVCRPHVADFERILQPVADSLSNGDTVYVHCVQGQVRSTALRWGSKTKMHLDLVLHVVQFLKFQRCLITHLYFGCFWNFSACFPEFATIPRKDRLVPVCTPPQYW